MKITDEILKSAGYKKYEVPAWKQYVDLFYQKRLYLADDKDDDLFIDAFHYPAVRPVIDDTWEFTAQLRRGSDDSAINITTCQWNAGKDNMSPEEILGDVELFFTKLYMYIRQE